MMQAAQIGTQVGRAIARDVIADGLPREWTGIDGADADRLMARGLAPGNPSWDAAVEAARVAYLATVRTHAAEAINGTIDGQYVEYHDDATNQQYRNPVEDLDYLAELLVSDDPDIRRDAYSHWCAATTGEEINS